MAVRQKVAMDVARIREFVQKLLSNNKKMKGDKKICCATEIQIRYFPKLYVTII